MADRRRQAELLEGLDTLVADPRELRPFRVLPIVRPAVPARAVALGSLFDGARLPDFHPMTLVIGTVGGMQTDLADGLPQVGVADGGTTIEVKGTTPGGWWTRRFTLSAFRMVVLDVSPFTDVSLQVLGSNLLGFGLGGHISDYPIQSTPSEPLLLSESYATIGRYDVPPGADQLFPAVADAGFSWRGALIGLNIADPAVVGATMTVRGQLFNTSVANFAGVWRIAR